MGTPLIKLQVLIRASFSSLDTFRKDVMMNKELKKLVEMDSRSTSQF